MSRTLPRAVLFDNDGVLSASEPLHWAAWGELLGEIGLPYQESELRVLVGKTAPEILTVLLNRHRPGWSRQEFDLHALALRKNDHYLDMTEEHLQTYPGVIDGLQWLRANGVKTAVVSNARRRELDATLDLLGFRELMDFTVSRDEVARPKPDPMPYHLAAATLGFAPEECLAVEDSPTGIEAALVGAIPAAAVATNFTEAMLRTPVPGRPDLKPVWIGPSMAALFEWLRGMKKG